MSDVVEDLIVRLTAEGNLTATTSGATSEVNKLTGALKTMASAGLGAAVGMMLQQGATLDAATQKLGADTGLSGQALADQGAAIDSMYKTSLESMDSIEASLAEVISGFDLTGQAADNLTAQFLKYEEATGQSSDAVKAMKDVTDAWNLSASDEGTLMDQLVASHQKFGTVIGDMQSALQKIAPSMQAMGMSEKDGVDLLNMFASAGIDSTKAAMGLQTAVKALKPGQTLNDLIVQISSIQDPLERAQEAGKIFGTRLGSQMADALQPGITSLDQFATSAQDTTDATDKAAQAIEDSWGSRFTLLMHQIGGTLATFGQSFGPLLMVGAQLGPKMAAGLGSLAGAIIPKIAEQLGLTLPTWIAGGTAEGVATGTAEVTAEAATIAAGGPEIGAAVAASGAEAAVAGTALGGVVGAAALVAIPAALIAGGLGLGAILGNLSIMVAGTAAPGTGANPFLTATPQQQANWTGGNDIYAATSGANRNEGSSAGQASLAAEQADTQAQAAYAASSASVVQQAADNATVAQLAADKTMIAQAAKDGYVGIPTAAQAASFESDLAIQQGLATQVSDIKNSKAALASAWTDAMNAEVSAQTIGYREQSNAADLASTEKQIADQKTWKKLTTQQKDALQEQLVQQKANQITLLEEDTQYGTDAQKAVKLAALLQSQALKDGLASTDPDTVAMWEQVQADSQTALDKLHGIMNTGGANAANALLIGMQDAIATGKIGISILGSASLTTKTSSKTSAGNGTMGGGGSGFLGYAAGTPYVANDQLAFLHKGEAVIPASQNMPGKGGGGGTVNLTINNPVPEPASRSAFHAGLLLTALGYVP